MTSGALGKIALEGSEMTLCSNPPLGVVRPEPLIEAASLRPEVVAVSESKFGGVGRPTNQEADRRRHEFARLIASGATLGEAQRGARISLQRALDLLDPPEMRQLAARAAQLRAAA